MDRLDKHRDNWREVELKIDLGTELPSMEADNLKVILKKKKLVFNSITNYYSH